MGWASLLLSLVFMLRSIAGQTVRFHITQQLYGFESREFTQVAYDSWKMSISQVLNISEGSIVGINVVDVITPTPMPTALPSSTAQTSVPPSAIVLSASPSLSPTTTVTSVPSSVTTALTAVPTNSVSTTIPSFLPTLSVIPSTTPSALPSALATSLSPSQLPSEIPTLVPTAISTPVGLPSEAPSNMPVTTAPSAITITAVPSSPPSQLSSPPSQSPPPSSSPSQSPPPSQSPSSQLSSPPPSPPSSSSPPLQSQSPPPSQSPSSQISPPPSSVPSGSPGRVLMTRALRGIGSVSSQQDHEKVNTKDHEKENDKNKNKKESIHPLPISFNNNNNIRTAAYVVNSAVTVTYNITTTLAALGIDVIDSSTNVIPPLVPGSPEEQACGGGFGSGDLCSPPVLAAYRVVYKRLNDSLVVPAGVGAAQSFFLKNLRYCYECSATMGIHTTSTSTSSSSTTTTTTAASSSNNNVANAEGNSPALDTRPGATLNRTDNFVGIFDTVTRATLVGIDIIRSSSPSETITDNRFSGSSSGGGSGAVSVVTELHAPPKTSKTMAIVWGVAAVVLVVGSFNVYLFFFYRHNQGGLGLGGGLGSLVNGNGSGNDSGRGGTSKSKQVGNNSNSSASYSSLPHDTSDLMSDTSGHDGTPVDISGLEDGDDNNNPDTPSPRSSLGGIAALRAKAQQVGLLSPTKLSSGYMPVSGHASIGSGGRDGGMESDFDLDDSFESPDRRHHMYGGVEMSMLSPSPEGGGGGGGTRPLDTDNSELDDVYGMGGSDFSGGLRAGKYQEQLQRLKASLGPDKQPSSSSPSSSERAVGMFTAAAVAASNSTENSNKSTSSHAMATASAAMTPNVDPFQDSHVSSSSTSASAESVYYSGLGGYVLQQRGDEVGSGLGESALSPTSNNTPNTTNTTSLSTMASIDNGHHLNNNGHSGVSGSGSGSDNRETVRSPDIDDNDFTDFQFAADFSTAPSDVPCTSTSAGDFPSGSGVGGGTSGSGVASGTSGNDDGTASAFDASGSGSGNSNALAFEFDAFQEAPGPATTSSISASLAFVPAPTPGPAPGPVADSLVGSIVLGPSMTSSPSSSSSSSHDAGAFDSITAATVPIMDTTHPLTTAAATPIPPAPSPYHEPKSVPMTMSTLPPPSPLAPESSLVPDTSFAAATTVAPHHPVTAVDPPSTDVMGSDVTGQVDDVNNPFIAFEEAACNIVQFEQAALEHVAFEQVVVEEETAFADVSMTEFTAAPISPPASSSSTLLTVTDPSAIAIAPDADGDDDDDDDDFGGFEAFTAAPISPGPSAASISPGPSAAPISPGPSVGPSLNAETNPSPSPSANASASGRDIMTMTMGSNHSFDLLDNPDLTTAVQGLRARVDSGLGLGVSVAQEDDTDDPFASLHGSLSNSALPSLI